MASLSSTSVATSMLSSSVSMSVSISPAVPTAEPGRFSLIVTLGLAAVTTDSDTVLILPKESGKANVPIDCIDKDLWSKKEKESARSKQADCSSTDGCFTIDFTAATCLVTPTECWYLGARGAEEMPPSCS